MNMGESSLKRVLLLIVVILVMLCLVGCVKNQKETGEVSPEQTSKATKSPDEIQLEELQKQITVVKNRKDFFDESGDLLYYIQKDYLTSNVDSINIYNIVSRYPKQDILPMEEEIIRIYPEDVYYDVTTHELSSVHNGILTIRTNDDWWWGSPHGYPSSFYINFVIQTGELYQFPIDIKEDIYQKAVDEAMNIVANNHYSGLMGFYYNDDGERIEYATYNQETETYSLTDEKALRDLVYRLLHDGSFTFKDDKIVFFISAEYSLSDWASRGAYSVIEIPNAWGI